MKICAAQTRPIAGNVTDNLRRHQQLIETAAANRVDFIIFPELSLTGYEPKLAAQLATDENDARLDCFQSLSDVHHMTIGVGLPLRTGNGLRIGMIFFQPNRARQVYAKQHLHEDELPYFEAGKDDLLLNVGGRLIAPAICYESLLPSHSEKAFLRQADVYAASVAKSAQGIEKATAHFSATSQKHSMAILMSNCLGPSDNFVSVGRSAVWNHRGTLLAQLDDKREGLLIYDMQAEVASMHH